MVCASMSRWPARGGGVLGVGRQVGGLRQLQVVQEPGLLVLHTLYGESGQSMGTKVRISYQGTLLQARSM